MPRQSPAPLTYRMVTEVFGLTLAIGALALATTPALSFATITKGVVVFAVMAVFILMIWSRYASMMSAGILLRKSNDYFTYALLIVVLLLPLSLRLLLTGSEETQALALNLIPLSFAAISAMIAVMIRRANPYQTKSKWRLVHHSLWIAAALYLLILAIPPVSLLTTEIPVRILACTVAFVVLPLIRRFGISYVATPAKPPTPRETSPKVSTSSSKQKQESGSSEKDNGRYRRRPRRRPSRKQNQGGSRRRV